MKPRPNLVFGYVMTSVVNPITDSRYCELFRNGHNVQ